MEEILSQYGLKEADLNRECSERVRDEVAIKLDDWEMTGRWLEFSLEKLRAGYRSRKQKPGTLQNNAIGQLGQERR